MSKTKKTYSEECKPRVLPALVYSPVVFTEEEHSYQYDGNYLSGVTSLLKRQLFADKYSDIPEFVLRKAAERGTKVHELCEWEDSTGLSAADDNEAFNTAAHRYTELREQAGFKAVENEYLVSDLQHVASKIDCVWSEGLDYVLADIKTTQKYDELYLRWQLSIYAYLFERQNMSAKVKALYCAWLPLHGEDFNPDEARLIPVERISDEEVEKLLAADRNGEVYEAPEGLAPAREVVVSGNNSLPAKLQDEMETYRNIVSMMKEAEEYKKRIEDDLHTFLSSNGYKSWDKEGDFKVTLTPPGERTTFDSKAFKAEHPDLFVQYCKTTQTKETIRITLR